MLRWRTVKPSKSSKQLIINRFVFYNVQFWFRVREQSHEIAQLKAENEFIRKQQQRIAAGPPQLPQKSGRHNQGKKLLNNIK